MKKTKTILVLAAAMVLAGCGKTAVSSSNHVVPETSSSAGVESSLPAPESSVETPVSSSEAPVSSSSSAPTSSSEAPVSSSTPVSSSSSEAPAPIPTMTKTAVELSLRGGKAYIVVKGTAENYRAGELKFAWGLQHNKTIDGVDNFIYGSADPADGDYKETVTVAADGTYVAEFCVSDVAGLTGGLYQIYCGAKGFYGQISASEASIQEATGEAGKYSFEYRSDSQCNNNAAISVGEVAPMTLTEAVVYEEDGKMWVKVGGELKDAFKDMTAADPAWNPFVNFQQVGGRWTNTRVQGDNLKWLFEDGKAYLCANIDFFQAKNNYNTHINFVANSQQNCKMAVDINETYVIGSRTVQVYSNTKASTSDQNEFWGNLGFRVTETASATIKAASLPEGVSNVKFATADYDDSSWTYIPNCEPASELKVYAPEGQTVMITWESEKTVTAIYVNNEPVYAGDHKAFFSVYEATTYTVTFEVADSTLNFEYNYDDFWFVDAAVYREDEYADVIYPDGGTSVAWKYAEGDYAMIAGQPVDGYILNNVYVNGEAAEKVTQTNPWGEEETFFMYSFTSAGDYVVTYDLIPAADTTLTWDVETEHVAYVDVMVYTADPSADPLYAIEDPVIEWAYAEGDMAYIMAVAENGYEIASVKVNGEETMAMPMGGADIGGGMIAYVYQFEDAGNYSVTIETKEATQAVNALGNYTTTLDADHEERIVEFTAPADDRYYIYVDKSENGGTSLSGNNVYGETSYPFSNSAYTAGVEVVDDEGATVSTNGTHPLSESSIAYANAQNSVITVDLKAGEKINLKFHGHANGETSGVTGTIAYGIATASNDDANSATVVTKGTPVAVKQSATDSRYSSEVAICYEYTATSSSAQIAFETSSYASGTFYIQEETTGEVTILQEGYVYGTSIINCFQSGKSYIIGLKLSTCPSDLKMTIGDVTPGMNIANPVNGFSANNASFSVPANGTSDRYVKWVVEEDGTYSLDAACKDSSGNGAYYSLSILASDETTYHGYSWEYCSGERNFSVTLAAGTYYVRFNAFDATSICSLKANELVLGGSYNAAYSLSYDWAAGSSTTLNASADGTWYEFYSGQVADLSVLVSCSEGATIEVYHYGTDSPYAIVQTINSTPSAIEFTKNESQFTLRVIGTGEVTLSCEARPTVTPGEGVATPTGEWQFSSQNTGFAYLEGQSFTWSESGSFSLFGSTIVPTYTSDNTYTCGGFGPYSGGTNTFVYNPETDTLVGTFITYDNETHVVTFTRPGSSTPETGEGGSTSDTVNLTGMFFSYNYGEHSAWFKDGGIVTTMGTDLKYVQDGNTIRCYNRFTDELMVTFTYNTNGDGTPKSLTAVFEGSETVVEIPYSGTY